MTQSRITPAKSLAGGLTWARRAWVLTASVAGAMLALSAVFSQAAPQALASSRTRRM